MNESRRMLLAWTLVAAGAVLTFWLPSPWHTVGAGVVLIGVAVHPARPGRS